MLMRFKKMMITRDLRRSERAHVIPALHASPGSEPNSWTPVKFNFHCNSANVVG